ncbi:hypothetical protein PG989_007733 [Apiospora arundinis]|uniref:Uncharacterized protein n=1 Tax=Apiospora arundinis TaxID=335852 RepID=A0ABR2J4N8_9PEZI
MQFTNALLAILLAPLALASPVQRSDEVLLDLPVENDTEALAAALAKALTELIQTKGFDIINAVFYGEDGAELRNTGGQFKRAVVYGRAVEAVQKVECDCTYAGCTCGPLKLGFPSISLGGFVEKTVQDGGAILPTV